MECPNCSRERKIREEYDKIIVQARRDKDALSQKVLDLENELKKRGKEERKDEATAKEKLNGLAAKAGPNSWTSDVSEDLKTAEVSKHYQSYKLKRIVHPKRRTQAPTGFHCMNIKPQRLFTIDKNN